MLLCRMGHAASRKVEHSQGMAHILLRNYCTISETVVDCAAAEPLAGVAVIVMV